MSTINKRVGFKFFLLLGTIVRLVIAPFSGYEFDVGVLKFAARSYYEHREVTLFTEWTSPPLLYYIVLVSYSFYYLLHYRFEEVAGLGIPDFYPLAHSVGALETLFLKLPFITADVLIFILLTRCCSLLGLDDKKGLFISNIYFLSPYTIFVSAAHGMWDSLAALFLVLGAYCLIRSHTEDDFKYVYYAVLSFTASFGVKWVGLAPLFVLGSLLLAKKEYTHLLKATLLSVGVLLLFYVP
ncbi:MAG: hypothetical protein GWO20_01325, partial [Candidatus Korarchaeota archaeon]|nr:hypothetical protein [Candidatus Korarchaeota archaeon]NIU83086.1 hypothetical protein [Candidatus Thorarchaeota archaeon]NIW12630.1 hypothetical protein [Candidatus Thorarchaeota archaeon]NIW50841.1 hypothetical protein [Candidatus Korarchaeota archaeon]